VKYPCKSLQGFKLSVYARLYVLTTQEKKLI